MKLRLSILTLSWSESSWKHYRWPIEITSNLRDCIHTLLLIGYESYNHVFLSCHLHVIVVRNTRTLVQCWSCTENNASWPKLVFWLKCGLFAFGPVIQLNVIIVTLLSQTWANPGIKKGPLLFSKASLCFPPLKLRLGLVNMLINTPALTHEQFIHW